MELNKVHTSAVSRRGLLAGAGAGAAVLAVAGCGGDSTGGSDSGGNSGGGANGSSPKGDGSGAAGAALTAVEDVPVGGAVSAENAKGEPVIVARPTESEVVAFSAVCTHKGCTVAPEGDRLACPCHGSTFDAMTGDNTGGPAPKPLAKVRVRVADGKVLEA